MPVRPISPVRKAAKRALFPRVSGHKTARMDSKLYELYVNDYADALYRFALRLFRESDSAKDAVQESFLRLWQNPHEINHPKAYLFKTLYRVFVDEQRQRKLLDTYAENIQKQGSEPSARPAIEQNERKEMIEEALKRLPDIQKTVVMLRDYEGYSYHEIGQIAGLSESQVKTYIFRARMNLRKQLGKPEAVLD